MVANLKKRKENPTDADQERRKELGNFIRAKREQLTPEQFSLPNGSRRRTPGLRRDELAGLLHISTTWLTKIEQGIARNVTPVLLENIARVLSLDPVEYNTLFHYAKQTPRHSPHQYVQGEITPALQQILDALGIYPAYIMSPRFDILGQNRSADLTYFDFETISKDERNVLRLMFLHPRLPQITVDWERHAETLVGGLRVNFARYLQDPYFLQLIQELSERSHDFQKMWKRHAVRERPELIKELTHPTVGRLKLVQNTLLVLDRVELTLVVDTPADADTLKKLQKLSMTPLLRRQT